MQTSENTSNEVSERTGHAPAAEAPQVPHDSQPQLPASANWTPLREGVYGTPDQVRAMYEDLVNLLTLEIDLPLDSFNTYTRSQYCSLPTLIKTIKPFYKRHNMALLQMPCLDGLACQLTHKGGASIVSVIPLILKNQDMTGLGSAISQARRYSAMAITGLSEGEASDKDGSANDERERLAQQQGNQRKPPARAEQPEQGPQVGSNAERSTSVAGVAGKIADANAPIVLETLGKIRNGDSLPRLKGTEESAPSKYAGEALKAILDAVRRRREELQNAQSSRPPVAA